MAKASARKSARKPALVGIVMERTFDAPRERLWKAWTDAEDLKRWWGPKPFTAPFIRVDPRVGGRFDYCMRSPDGKDYCNTGAFREIVPLERFVATVSFADEKGNVVPATHYGMSAEIPMEQLWTVTFEELEGGRTKVVMRHDGFPTAEESLNARMGWESSLDKLAELVE